MEKLTLRQLRGMRGVTQKKMAKMIGFTPAGLRRYEKCEAYVPFDVVQKYCELLNWSTDDVIVKSRFSKNEQED